MQTAAAMHAEQEAAGEREDVIERQRGDDDHLFDRRRHREQRCSTTHPPARHWRPDCDAAGWRPWRRRWCRRYIAGRRYRRARPSGRAKVSARPSCKRVVEFSRARQRIGGTIFLTCRTTRLTSVPFMVPSMSPMLATTTCFTAVCGSASCSTDGEILQHDDGFGAGIVELKFQLARLVQRIDVHHGHAGAQDGGDRHRILQHVRHHDGDAGAALRDPCFAARRRTRARPRRARHRSSVLPMQMQASSARVRAEAFLEHRHQRGDSARRRSRRARPADNAAARPFHWPFHGVSPCRRFRAGAVGEQHRSSREAAQGLSGAAAC